MSDQSIIRDLCDRWERVRHEGRFELVAGGVAPTCIRHDESGTRRVTPEEYAAEIAASQKERPNTRFVVYDHAFVGDRAWFRFKLQWTDPTTNEIRTRAGMQVYRIEAGKLAETWLTLLKPASSWPDAVSQEHWTRPRSPSQP